MALVHLRFELADEAKKWVRHAASDTGKALVPAFAKFVVEPIRKLISAAMDGQVEEVERRLLSLGVVLSESGDMLVCGGVRCIVLCRQIARWKALYETMSAKMAAVGRGPIDSGGLLAFL